MIARQIDPMAEFQSTFTLLTKNLALAAIPTVALILVGCVFALVLVLSGASALMASGFGSPEAWGAMIGTSLVSLGIAAIVAIIVLLISQAAVIACAEAVWQGRAPELSAGLSRAFARALDLFLAGFVLAVIFIAVSWTFVGPLALIFLMLYVAPAIVVGGEGAFVAMGTSWRLATQNFGPTFGAFIGLVVVAVVGGIVNAIIGHVPIIGWVAALLISGFITAYQALIAVRFYDLLRAPAAPPAMTV